MSDLTYDQIAERLEGHARAGRLVQLEAESRQILAGHRHFLWHQYLIVALLRSGRREEAARELDDLMTYKFNIAERAFPEVLAAFPGKFEGHYILDTMKQELAIEIEGSVRRRWAVDYPLADTDAFGRAVDHLVGEAVPALPLLDRAAPVTTFGSCFAANLARVLKGAGVDASNLLIEESINSPLANRAFLTGLARPEGFEHLARLKEVYGDEFLGRARARLAGAQVIVITLGVAPAFYHVGSDHLAFLVEYRELLKQGKVYMRTPPVEETKQAINDVLGLVRVLNPGARVYVSISPVPLVGTAELPSAMVADCVSKTTLRAALHEVLQARSWPEVHYWPSFEIVRWLGGHTSLPAFGADDAVSRHVSNWLVDLIVDRFSRHLFGEAAPRPAGPAPATPGTAPPISRWSGR